MKQIILVIILIFYVTSKNDQCTTDDFCKNKYNSKYYCDYVSSNCIHENILTNLNFSNILGKKLIK